MQELKYPHLFQPITLGKTLFRNRLFGSPTGCQNLMDGKYPSSDTIAYYARKASGGPASVAVGECVVDSLRGRGGPAHILMDDPKSLLHLSKLTDSISRYGAVPVAELQHAGMFSQASQADGNAIYGPVEMEVQGQLVHAGTAIKVLEMPEEIIEQTIEAYANAARFAKQCGFGMVLIHGGHGWLISQFLEPKINTRRDQWGGSLENRMRFPLAVVDRIRYKCGRDFPIEFRMSGDECNPNGYDFDEGKEIAKALDGKVDLIHVSTGHHEVRDAFVQTHPDMFHLDGCNAHYAAEIKKLVKTPVATVGAFSDPALMEEIIASGQADVVEVARGLIADPDLPRKARAGKDQDIKQCMRCFTCFSNLLTNGQFVCSINPEIGNEAELPILRSAERKKTVLIAGGGVSGMEAALDAVKCGHRVILCEKTDRLGGALRCEEKVPFKEKLYRYLELQSRLVMESSADVRLNTEVTPELARLLHPDVIIAALGARPAIPPISGIDKKIVAGAEDSYIHPEKAGRNVVMLGGGLVGIELSLYLAGMGHEVTIVEMMPELNNGGNVLHEIALDTQIRQRGVKLSLATKVLEITESGVSAENAAGKLFFAADTVIYATGQRPLWDEAEQLRCCSAEFYQIGDCVMPKNIRAATASAYHIVGNIGRI